MPHSSGGGHSGGHSSGGHGGSFGGHGRSGSGGSVHYSKRYFTGARLYRYGRHRNKYMWCSSDIDEAKAISIRAILFILLVATLLFCKKIVETDMFNYSLFTGMKLTSQGLVPEKIVSAYDYIPSIKDEHGYISEGKAELLNTLSEIKEKTGITVQILTIRSDEILEENDMYTNGYIRTSALEKYAYNKYLELFKDEKQWLIVYEVDAEDPNVWEFHGMQGDDTDPILTWWITYCFNAKLTKNLEADEPVGIAFNNALTELKEKTMQVDESKTNDLKMFLVLTLLTWGVAGLLMLPHIRRLVFAYAEKEPVTDEEEIKRVIERQG